ncbi:MAG: cation:proton antiporter [Actinomycetota bacterium]|nr:cation:proton antiporter [Actinomycetota bacterium]
MSVELFDLLYLAAGLGALLAAVLPRPLERRPFSMPLVFVGLGLLLFVLPLPLPRPDPVTHRALLEHATEAVVIISLMGAGLALNRPVGLRRWSTTWRLLGVAMPLTVAGVAAVVIALLGWPVAAALLVGAVLAPTDPVLASDVQVAEPTDEHEDEDEVRFSLTSEAGLNDGLAFPIVYAAIALAGAAGGSWVAEWAIEAVAYKIAIGLGAGLVVGRVLAWGLFGVRRESMRLSEHSDGFVAVAVTFLAYGATELLRGYGFLAVFVAACVIRAAERTHGYHRVLHSFVEQIERLLTSWLLLVLGGAVIVLGGITWTALAVALALVLVVRPLAGLVALIGTPPGWRERVAISFFGIRGMGSLYYLSYALGAGVSFGVGAEHLWRVVAATVVVSVVVHGIAATPVMRRLDLLRHERVRERGIAEPGPRDVAAERL